LKTSALVLLAACAKTSGSSSSGDAARLVALAESGHHCAGEEPYDEERSAFLANCVQTSLAEARPLLARLAPGALAPADLAVVRLFVEEALTSEETKTLCAQVPAEDFMPGLLDDEARARCGLR